ncbi:Hydroxymethylglutaryl-CoA synthase, cytoplasmic [Smittium mucronatum]|uniref:Hydroxymethylglutaryl-CoA synthase n=1 Tax=Smittium mucronatum TaxID=133383 RepID=A0A1R0GZW3_9FUNG|nr:Hydroxymethylglutaryl-CoA synthase, cytoplasmic [Smittium mucronatum]
MTVHPRPENVGIKAIDLYFPRKYVDQVELEKHDGVSAGKYTIGLGQDKMSFCDDREVVKQFMAKYNIDYKDIGRLEVGTETLIDKSKSTKTFLMSLFNESGNYSVEGIDTTNACYGGTSALFNAIQWVDSRAWDGRLALVVSGDIAVYASGNARPSGGAGVACILVGPDAPLFIEFPIRGTFMEHVYDFYKPDLSSEFPTVDGPLSVVSYLRALDYAYLGYLDKLEKTEKIPLASLSDIDFLVFHSPYTKQVAKGFARLLFNDYLRDKTNPKYAEILDQYPEETLESSYSNKALEKLLINLSKPIYIQKTMPSLLAARNIGNMYTGSVFFGLASLLSSVGNSDLQGKRIALFSYGSGCAASMYSFTVHGDVSSVVSKIDLKAKLDDRIEVSPVEFEKMMQLRENTHNKVSYSPKGSVEELFPGTVYLDSVDSMWRRHYNTFM